MSKEFEIKIIVKDTKDNIAGYKKQLERMMNNEVSVFAQNFAKEFLIYKDMKITDAPKDWLSFRSKNAGIIAAAVMDNIDKTKINMKDPRDTRVHIEPLPNGISGTQVVIEGSTNEAASKAYEERKLTERDVFNEVTKLSPSSISTIFKRAADGLRKKK
jgi:hypothetical protein